MGAFHPKKLFAKFSHVIVVLIILCTAVWGYLVLLNSSAEVASAPTTPFVAQPQQELPTQVPEAPAVDTGNDLDTVLQAIDSMHLESNTTALDEAAAF